ncbi:hypothetical protein CC78DRAFT_577205 [Lojkania enalia]|uniref:F-box domain-containing protein n=1 Tax=Lojkania enalia TaxID=147567 RepID=A0A9P4N2N8_9PLEO|nr:hypothetical protein CC78DRAFT_577205 [Didymosphaeria enalia]
MQHHISDDDEPLEDKTVAIPLKSKRTERVQRKRAIRDQKRKEAASLSQLPTELILEILKLLHASDVFSFAVVDRRFHSLVLANASIIGDEIIERRYAILAQCFPLPHLLADVDPSIQPLLVEPTRQKQLGIHKKPYQHVHPPDPHFVCTCLTCILTWNNLSLILDFAHWQDNLDNGKPIPILPRGRTTEWNQALIDRYAEIVRKALGNSLWHAWILELHLGSTIRSIKRHQENKGNKRKHVEMTEEEAEAGTDQFLAKPGPLSLEFPFNRDEYYMLEAYIPNRWWKKAEQKWVYTIAGQHSRDLGLLVRFANR